MCWLLHCPGRFLSLSSSLRSFFRSSFPPGLSFTGVIHYRLHSDAHTHASMHIHLVIGIVFVIYDVKMCVGSVPILSPPPCMFRYVNWPRDENHSFLFELKCLNECSGDLTFCFSMFGLETERLAVGRLKLVPKLLGGNWCQNRWWLCCVTVAVPPMKVDWIK